MIKCISINRASVDVCGCVGYVLGINFVCVCLPACEFINVSPISTAVVVLTKRLQLFICNVI